MERKFTWNDENKEVVKGFMDEMIDILFQIHQFSTFDPVQFREREVERLLKLLGFSDSCKGTRFIQDILNKNWEEEEIRAKEIFELYQVNPENYALYDKVKESKSMRYAIHEALKKRTPLAMELYPEYFSDEHVKLTTKKFLRVATRYLKRLEKYPQ